MIRVASPAKTGTPKFAMYPTARVKEVFLSNTVRSTNEGVKTTDGLLGLRMGTAKAGRLKFQGRQTVRVLVISGKISKQRSHEHSDK